MPSAALASPPEPVSEIEGSIAARAVRGMEADGYSVLVTTTAIAINPTMYKKLDFTVDQLAAVAIPAASPETLAAHPRLESTIVPLMRAHVDGMSISIVK